jgi:hypothetical protein
MCVNEPTELLKLAERLVQAFENQSDGPHGPLPEASRLLAERFPDFLFKFQELGEDGFIRVRGEFTTPMIRGALSGHGRIGGKPSLLKSEIAIATVPEIRTGLLSEDVSRITDIEAIRRYISAHFPEGPDNPVDEILGQFNIKCVYFFPVRKHNLPFGMISISSPRMMAPPEEQVWRLVSRMISLACLRRDDRCLADLQTRVLASLDVPFAIIDASMELLVAGKRLYSLLNETDRLKVRKTVLQSHDTWVQRDKGANAVSMVLGRKISIPVEFHEEEVFDSRGELLGFVLWYRVEKVPRRTETPRLSDRELEILRYIAEGTSNRDIAARIGRSIYTVQYHRSALRKKLRPQDSRMTFQQMAASILADA